VFDDDEVTFDAETPFEAIEDWDSLNHVHMVVAMERAFGIRFTDTARLQGLVRVRELLDLVAELKGV
jgi:acyl carrier protein